ncbi:MAG: hypothetical protein KatS3mg127_1594 [Silanimonas sp.]|nr:MAG: hypothetical protein KatS3mg127_1594 [Silanimonas sp.]
MSAALICGSLAYDTIMVFPDQFKNHILPDKVHILNVSFLVPRMRREFGGCAGNIAYNLNLLGGKPLPMATVGQDFGPYRAHFEEQGIPLTYVKEIPDLYTAQAFITTDLDDNQITAFHPGAMMRSYENHVRDVPGVSFGIVGPDGYEAMLQNCAEFAECGIPFIFDPGQAMPLYNGEELRRMIDQATYVTVNDYESSLLQERTGWSAQEIAKRGQGLLHHPRPQGLRGPYPGRHDPHPLGHRDAGGRPHRLRRCLPRRPDLRLHERTRSGHHRAYRQPDGGAEDRAPRPSEPALRLPRVRRAVPPAVRLRALMRRARPARKALDRA